MKFRIKSWILAVEGEEEEVGFPDVVLQSLHHFGNQCIIIVTFIMILFVYFNGKGIFGHQIANQGRPQGGGARVALPPPKQFRGSKKNSVVYDG